MPKLKSDGRPPSASGLRVKAASRRGGSASALALTREPDVDTLNNRKSPLTRNTVAEEALHASSRRTRGPSGCFDTNAVAFGSA